MTPKEAIQHFGGIRAAARGLGIPYSRMRKLADLEPPRKRGERQGLSAERVRDLLDYDKVTGQFTWRRTRRGTARAGMVAGNPRDRDGYVTISIDDYPYLAHRLAWLHVYGYWPSMVDHADLDRSNNRISNLREATPADNQRNQPKRRGTATPYKGVRFKGGNRKKPWQADIKTGSRTQFLGYFATPEQAQEAYASAARLHFGQFARLE